MRIVVIGGGISGLTAAYRLSERAPQGTEVTLVEAADRAGGHVRTRREDGFLVEAGPNGFLLRPGEPQPLALVRDVGLGEALVPARPAARRRFVVRGGRLRRVPDSPATFLASDALSPAGKLRVLLEPFVPRAAGREESVFQFASRRVGRETAEVLVDTAVAGISAGDSHALSVAAAFPLMVEMEREHGSLIRAMLARREGPPRLVGLASGMASLTDALAARLGERLRTGARVRRIERAEPGWRVVLDGAETLAADRIVLAAPAWQAAAMVEDWDTRLARELSEIPCAGLAVVALAFRAADLPRPLEGYGYLVARSEGLDTLGVVWESSLFDGRAPGGMVLLRAMLGGARRPELAHLDEEELAARARRELARLLGVGAAPAGVWVWRWPRAIAQYTHGHLARVARARAALHAGLELCGTSYDGIAFGAGIVSAEQAVARVLASLAQGEPPQRGASSAAPAGAPATQGHAFPVPSGRGPQAGPAPAAPVPSAATATAAGGPPGDPGREPAEVA